MVYAFRRPNNSWIRVRESPLHLYFSNNPRHAWLISQTGNLPPSFVLVHVKHFLSTMASTPLLPPNQSSSRTPSLPQSSFLWRSGALLGKHFTHCGSPPQRNQPSTFSGYRYAVWCLWIARPSRTGNAGATSDLYH